MDNMKLSYFTQDESFPFYINYGTHTENMFLHGHEDFFELVIILDGRADHVVGEQRFKVQKGDVFAVGNDIYHGYENPENLKICNIMFRPEALISADHDIKQLPGFHALFLIEPSFTSSKNFKSRLKIGAGLFSEIKHIIGDAIREYASGNKGRKTMLTSYFLRLAVILSRAYEEAEPMKEIAGIAEAAAYMESNYSEDISIERLVDISHYSQRHFIRLFSDAYHVSPQKYLTSIRLRHACTILKDTDLSVTETAMYCGFGDPNYFSRIFKKYSGMTPLQYRKEATLI